MLTIISFFLYFFLSGTAVWRNKLIIAGGQRSHFGADKTKYCRMPYSTSNPAPRDNLDDHKTARIVNLETGIWEAALPELPGLVFSRPAMGVLDNFVYIVVTSWTVPGAVLWNIVRYDMAQGYEGRWQLLPNRIERPQYMRMLNTRFSLHAMGGQTNLGSVGGTGNTGKFQMSHANTQISACPAGCFMERATDISPSPSKDVCLVCPAGTYNAFADQPGQASCLPCSDGSVTSRPGELVCVKCSAGWSSKFILY